MFLQVAHSQLTPAGDMDETLPMTDSVIADASFAFKMEMEVDDVADGEDEEYIPPTQPEGTQQVGGMSILNQL